jgi:hypothetical protein
MPERRALRSVSGQPRTTGREIGRSALPGVRDPHNLRDGVSHRYERVDNDEVRSDRFQAGVVKRQEVVPRLSERMLVDLGMHRFDLSKLLQPGRLVDDVTR